MGVALFPLNVAFYVAVWVWSRLRLSVYPCLPVCLPSPGLPIGPYTLCAEFAHFTDPIMVIAHEILAFRIAISVAQCGLTPAYFGSPGKPGGEKGVTVPLVTVLAPAWPNWKRFFFGSAIACVRARPSSMIF